MAPKTRAGEDFKAVPVSQLTEKDLVMLRGKNPGFTFRRPQQGEAWWNYRDGELCFFPRFLHDGMSLPLQQHLVDFFAYFGLVPAQFAPNSFVHLRGLWSFMAEQGLKWTMSNLMALVTIGQKKDTGFLFVAARDCKRLTLLGTPKGIHDWKNKFVFVRSQQPWGFPTVPRPVDLSVFKNYSWTQEVVDLYRRLNCNAFSLNTITFEVFPDTAAFQARPIQSVPSTREAGEPSRQVRGPQKKRAQKVPAGKRRPQERPKRRRVVSDDAELDDINDFDLDERLYTREEVRTGDHLALVVASEAGKFSFPEVGETDDEEMAEAGGDFMESPHEEEGAADLGAEEAGGSADTSWSLDDEAGVPPAGGLQTADDADSAGFSRFQLVSRNVEAGRPQEVQDPAVAEVEEDQVPLSHLLSKADAQQARRSKAAEAGLPQMERGTRVEASGGPPQAMEEDAAPQATPEGSAAGQGPVGESGADEPMGGEQAARGGDSAQRPLYISLDSDEEREMEDDVAVEELLAEAEREPAAREQEIEEGDEIPGEGQPILRTAEGPAEEGLDAEGGAPPVGEEKEKEEEREKEKEKGKGKEKEKGQGQESSSATRVSASGGSTGPASPGYWRDEKNKAYSFKCSPDMSLIPRVKAESLPAHITRDMLSDIDLAYLGTLDELELLKLQSHLAVAACQVSRHVSDRCYLKGEILAKIKHEVQKGKEERKKLAEEVEALKAGAEGEKETHQAEMAKLQAEVTRVSEGAKDLVAQKAKLQAEALGSAAEVEELKAQMESLKATQAIELKKLQETTATVVAQLQQTQAAVVSDLQSELESKGKQVAALEKMKKQELQVMQGSWDLDREKLEELQRQHAGTSAEVVKLTAELEKASAPPSLEAAKAVYEKSREFQETCSLVGCYGFNLLKEVLVKDKIVSEELLETIGYNASLKRQVEGEL